MLVKADFNYKCFFFFFFHWIVTIGDDQSADVHLNTDQLDGFEPPTRWRSALEGGGGKHAYCVLCFPLRSAVCLALSLSPVSPVRPALLRWASTERHTGMQGEKGWSNQTSLLTIFL